jgi:hypothetical protein
MSATTITTPAATSTTATEVETTTAPATAQAAPKEPTSVELRDAIGQRLKQLAKANTEWEQGAYKTANEGLYVLIQGCKQIYEDLTNAQDPNLMHKKQGLNDYLSLNGMDDYTSKPLPQKIIRCVFGNRDRRRISTYHVVLRSLIADKVEAANVPSHIAACGGVQEMSLGRKPGKLTTADKVKLVKSSVQAQVLGQVQTPQTDLLVNPEKHGDTFAAVLTQNTDGSFTINCIVDSKGAVNAALTAYYGAEEAKKSKKSA